jgi:hypothetical protein
MQSKSADKPQTTSKSFLWSGKWEIGNKLTKNNIQALY